MNVREHYNRWAATYDHDRNLTRDLDHAATRAVLRDYRVDSILELGCGTGKNTQFLTTLGTSVHALDFAESMLEHAKAKHPTVTFTVADLTHPWPCDTGSIDLIVCNLVLEHIQDLDWIFAEAARVLRPQGRFFLVELHPFKQYQGSKANFQADSQQVAIPAFVHHTSDFFAAATKAGFTLNALNEWWHAEDSTIPRLISFVFALLPPNP